MSNWIDLQVNGFLGKSFTSSDLAAGDIAFITESLAERGTTGYLATIITSSLELYRHALPLMGEAVGADGQTGLLGIHMEGPFISPEPGAVGAHKPQYVQPPSIELFDEFMELAQGQIKFLTVAPEREGAIELIEHAASRGVAVSIGHALPDRDDVDAAIRAGARYCTHLGNGMPGMIDRHHNPLWAQLARDELTAMIITDGHHLPPDVIRVILKVKGPERVIITSDAASIAGCPPGQYKDFGINVEIEPSGRINNLDAPGLAGSSAVMEDCVQHLRSLNIVDDAAIDMMARTNPLKAING